MKKVLIVDDVPGWVRFHSNNLEYLGIEGLTVDFAYSAREAISKIEASIDEPYEVIFTDLQMESDFLPKYAGERFIEEVQFYKEYANTKIVIVSASPSIAKIAEKYGVSYLPKPVVRNSGAEIYREFV